MQSKRTSTKGDPQVLSMLANLASLISKANDEKCLANGNARPWANALPKQRSDCAKSLYV